MEKERKQIFEHRFVVIPLESFSMYLRDFEISGWELVTSYPLKSYKENTQYILFFKRRV